MNKYLRLFTIIFTCIYFFSSTVAPVLAARAYDYDANGNMTSDGTKCFEYNEANQVKKVKDCGNNQTIAEYTYDYKGNRIVKKQYQNGDLQKTVISPNDSYEVLKLASNSAKFNTTYYYANDQLISKKDPYGNRTYYHNDHLGSAAVITNQAGTLVEETSYYPFGEVRSGGTKSKFQYTGQEKDNETGLNYYNARYYDPHIRRFTQPDDIVQDPYDPQMLNRYSYVRNNPLRYTDPTGHFLFAIPLVYWAIGSAGIITSFYLATPQGQNTIVKPLVTSIATQLTNLYTMAKSTISTYTNRPAPPPPPSSGDTGGKNGGGSSSEGSGKSNTGGPKTESPKLKYDNPNRNPAQDKRLTRNEIERLQKGGEDVEEMKDHRSDLDLFKDPKTGDIHIKPKNGKGFGTPADKNLKDFN